MRAADHEAFFLSPVGRFAVAEDHLVWCWSPGLAGAAHWGGPETVAHVFRRLTLALPDAAVVTDVSGAALVEPLDLDGRVGAHALVCGTDTPVPRARHPVGLFEEAAEAFAWLGVPGAAIDVACVIAEAAAARETATRLRAILARRMGDLEEHEAGRGLHLSPRALRVALAAAGTTFHREREAAQVRAARVMLETSDFSIESVAHAVGCSSMGAFARMFHRATGVRPAQLRRAQKVSSAVSFTRPATVHVATIVPGRANLTVSSSPASPTHVE